MLAKVILGIPFHNAKKRNKREKQLQRVCKLVYFKAIRDSSLDPLSPELHLAVISILPS
jgi:hypothetical protein